VFGCDPAAGRSLRIDEARLAKAARCGEADRNPVGRGTLERVEPVAAIDQPSWSDGALLNGFTVHRCTAIPDRS
jgi:hypothetical protein